MRKIIILSLITALLLTGCAVENEHYPAETAETAEAAEATEDTSTDGHHHLPETMVSGMSGGTVDLPDAGLYGLTVGHMEYGAFNEACIGEAYLLYDYLEEGSERHYPYLAINTGDKTLVKDVTYDYINSVTGEEDSLFSLSTSMCLCDLDGDVFEYDSGYQEIIVHQCIAMSGGWGGWNSRIFRVEGDEIVEIFNTESFHDGVYDTGFTYKINEDYSVLIKNSYTGEEYLLDSEEEKELVRTVRYGGAPSEEQKLWCDSMYSFEPVGPKDGGGYQIKCLQYTCIGSHVDFIGVAEVILEYDGEQDTFVIVDSDFIRMSEANFVN